MPEKSRHKIVEHVKRYYRELYSGKIAPSVKVCSGKILAQKLGYPRELLDWLSRRNFSWDQTYPCGNPTGQGFFKPGSVVLNLGCGIGLDAYALMFEVQKEPSCYQKSIIVNVDVVPAVIQEACCWMQSVDGIPDNVELLWICADALKLPFGEELFNLAVLNGVFNVFPDKTALLRELRRVIKREGKLVVADLFATGPLPDFMKREPDAWAWCIAGALPESELSPLLLQMGFGSCEWFEKEPIDEIFYRGIFAAERLS